LIAEPASGICTSQVYGGLTASALHTIVAQTVGTGAAAAGSTQQAERVERRRSNKKEGGNV
jgi:phosphate/sulfate permease